MRSRPLHRLVGALRPALVGAAYLVGLAALALSGLASDERVQGVRAGAVVEVIRASFGDELRRVAIFFVAAAAVLGLVLGALAGALVRLRDRMARLPRASDAAFVARAGALAVAMHAALAAYDVASRPQLYEAALYARGGARRTLQVLLTDTLGPRGVVLVALALFVPWMLGPRQRRRAWPRRVARAFAPPRSTNARRALFALAGFALVAALFSRELFARRATKAHPERPNVVILAADSLRDDHVRDDVAPRLAALGREGTRFSRAYVSLPRTFPSWVTWLTGRLPQHHGVRTMFPRVEARSRVHDALPARLAATGTRTAVVSDFAGDVFGRVDLGFRRLDVPGFSFREIVWQRALAAETPLLPFARSRAVARFVPSLREMANASDAEAVTDGALEAIDEAGDAPFFVVAFYSTTHFPYAAPAPFYGRFADHGYRGRYKYDKPHLLGDEAPPDDADVAQVRALYAGAVAAVDAAAGRLLDGLDERGRARDTIVVLLADHGETLLEGGHAEGHGDHLFGDEGTHVPLVIRLPGGEGAHASGAIVRDVDLEPTLGELLGLPATDAADGRSLVPALRGEPLAPALAYAETGLWFTEDVQGVPPSLRLPYPDVAHATEVLPERGDDVVLRAELEGVVVAAKHRMVRDERYKLVRIPTRDGVVRRLFDTAEDPLETRDVAASHPDVVERLDAALTRLLLDDRELRRAGDWFVPRASEAPEQRGGPPAIRVVDEGAR